MGRILRDGRPAELGSLSACGATDMEAGIRPLDGAQRPPVAFPGDELPAHRRSEGSDRRRENPQPAHVALRNFASKNPISEIRYRLPTKIGIRAAAAGAFQ